MRLGVIQDLEKRIYNGVSFRTRTFLEKNLYSEINPVTQWLLDQLLLKVRGIKKFKPFEQAAAVINDPLGRGDAYYLNLFRTGGFINDQAKDHESATPFTDAVRSAYNTLFKDHRVNDERLVIYAELKDQIERGLGLQLASVASIQRYKDWVVIDRILETDNVIKEAWLKQLPLSKLRAVKKDFSGSKQKRSLGDTLYLHFSHRDQKKAAKEYARMLRKLPKNPVFSFVESAVNHSDQVFFTAEVSLQKRLSKKLGIPSYVSFIDQLRFPIAQDHAFFFVGELEEYPAIIGEICSRGRRKTAKAHLLIMALRNYFNFVSRSIAELEHLSNNNSYDERESIEEAKNEARHLYNEWMNTGIKESFEAILDAIFARSPLSASKHFHTFFNWLSSYSKLRLTHPSMQSKKKFIDLLQDSFLERLKRDAVSYHSLADQLLITGVNHEGLSMLPEILSANPADTVFHDKTHTIYCNHLQSDQFRWFSNGDVDTVEAINQAYSFGTVLGSYPNGYEKWKDISDRHHNVYEGWNPTPVSSNLNYRESYLFTSGVGMAYYKYDQGSLAEANNIIFNVTKLLLRQLRAAMDRTVVDYETPLWFAGATLSKFDGSMKDRFIMMIGEEVDSLKLYIRVVYETLINAPVIDLLPATSEAIANRIKNEFFIIENNKTDVELRGDFVYYREIKEKILEMIKT